jgi:hypothetical protein
MVPRLVLVNGMAISSRHRYTRLVLWDMLGRYSESDQGTAIRVSGDLSNAAPQGRDLELQWPFDFKPAALLRNLGTKEDEKSLPLLGRTPSEMKKLPLETRFNASVHAGAGISRRPPIRPRVLL